MATMASAVRDITTTSLGRDNLTAVAARSVPVTATHPIPLPTPPNSISPTLPPHGLKAQLQRARMDQHVDSDLDLHGDHDTDHHGSVGSPPYESAGINAAMLAKFHLPEILLNHGPLAIRHIMGYLTSSIPGFAEIPPTKARRLVVGALEGRGSGGEGGGLEGDVQFEKVGWGIWQARKRGQPSSGYTAARRASPHGDGEPASIPIARHGGWNLDRLRTAAAGSLDGESCAAFSFDDRSMHMMDHEADRMSLDGSASASCSEAPDDDEDVAMDEDTEDATDDEDWAAVGAAALRATSYQAPSDRFLTANSVYSSGGLRSFSSSVGMARSPQFRNFNFPTTPALTTPSDAQEREAVEALLRLGSV